MARVQGHLAVPSQVWGIHTKDKSQTHTSAPWKPRGQGCVSGVRALCFSAGNFNSRPRSSPAH